MHVQQGRKPRARGQRAGQTKGPKIIKVLIFNSSIHLRKKKQLIKTKEQHLAVVSIAQNLFIFFSFYNMGQRITANCFSLYTSTHKIYRGHVCTAQTNAATMYTHFIACSQHTEEPQRGQRSCPPMNIGCHTRWQPAQGRYPIRTDSHWSQINRS